MGIFPKASKGIGKKTAKKKINKTNLERIQENEYGKRNKLLK